MDEQRSAHDGQEPQAELPTANHLPFTTSIPTTLTRKNVFLHEASYTEEAMHGFNCEATSTPYGHALAAVNAACGMNSAPFPSFSSMLNSARTYKSHVDAGGNPIPEQFVSSVMDVHNYIYNLSNALENTASLLRDVSEHVVATNEGADALAIELDETTVEEELRMLTSPDVAFEDAPKQIELLYALGNALAVAQGIAAAARQVVGLRSSVFDTSALFAAQQVYPEVGIMLSQVGASFRVTPDDVARHIALERTAGLLLTVIARNENVCQTLMRYIYVDAYEDFLLRRVPKSDAPGAKVAKVEIDSGLINMRVNGVFLREHLECTALINLDSVTIDEASMRMVERSILGVFAQHYSEVIGTTLRESMDAEILAPLGAQNCLAAILSAAEPYVDLSVEHAYTLPMLAVLDRMSGGSALVAKNQMSSSADYYKRLIYVLLDDTGEEMIDFALSFDMP